MTKTSNETTETLKTIMVEVDKEVDQFNQLAQEIGNMREVTEQTLENTRNVRRNIDALMAESDGLRAVIEELENLMKMR